MVGSERDLSDRDVRYIAGLCRSVLDVTVRLMAILTSNGVSIDDAQRAPLFHAAAQRQPKSLDPAGSLPQSIAQ